MDRLVELPASEDHDWVAPLCAWEYYCRHVLSTEGGEDDVQLPEQSPSELPIDGVSETCRLPARFSALTFRVTCTRSGRKHVFTSQDAARSLGAGILNHFKWKVNLTQPQVEVLLNIFDNQATICIALTREAKFKRNIVHFWPDDSPFDTCLWPATVGDLV